MTRYEADWFQTERCTEYGCGAVPTLDFLHGVDVDKKNLNLDTYQSAFGEDFYSDALLGLPKEVESH